MTFHTERGCRGGVVPGRHGGCIRPIPDKGMELRWEQDSFLSVSRTPYHVLVGPLALDGVAIIDTSLR